MFGDALVKEQLYQSNWDQYIFFLGVGTLGRKK